MGLQEFPNNVEFSKFTGQHQERLAILYKLMLKKHHYQSGLLIKKILILTKSKCDLKVQNESDLFTIAEK